ncbi:hypothetical protein GOP47_0013543 [Adiantum capillus-veneris]|uniref:Uncharacterized protein n=1 Tax=Adiantum capillus-veneris TaxID=13818 RepID=A0A9D4UPP2_ADICA|nr:hypothetical protein GOP47_0013543 [Adiantum capillus-veneris]
MGNYNFSIAQPRPISLLKIRPSHLVLLLRLERSSCPHRLRSPSLSWSRIPIGFAWFSSRMQLCGRFEAALDVRSCLASRLSLNPLLPYKHRLLLETQRLLTEHVLESGEIGT